jgi:Flp pilus assembly pilin Flp
MILGAGVRAILRWRAEAGQTSVEYAAVLALVAIALVLTMAVGFPHDVFSPFWAKVKAAID